MNWEMEMTGLAMRNVTTRDDGGNDEETTNFRVDGVMPGSHAGTNEGRVFGAGYPAATTMHPESAANVLAAHLASLPPHVLAAVLPNLPAQPPSLPPFPPNIPDHPPVAQALPCYPVHTHPQASQMSAQVAHHHHQPPYNVQGYQSRSAAVMPPAVGQAKDPPEQMGRGNIHQIHGAIDSSQTIPNNVVTESQPAVDSPAPFVAHRERMPPKKAGREQGLAARRRIESRHSLGRHEPFMIDIEAMEVTLGMKFFEGRFKKSMFEGEWSRKTYNAWRFLDKQFRDKDGNVAWKDGREDPIDDNVSLYAAFATKFFCEDVKEQCKNVHEQRVIDNANEYAYAYGTPYCATELDVRKVYLNMKSSVIAGGKQYLNYNVNCYQGIKRSEEESEWHPIAMERIIRDHDCRVKIDFGRGRPCWAKHKHCLSLMINNHTTNNLNSALHRDEKRVFGVKVWFSSDITEDHEKDQKKYRIETLSSRFIRGFTRRAKRRVLVEIVREMDKEINFDDMVNNMSTTVLHFKHANKGKKEICRAFNNVMSGELREDDSRFLFLMLCFLTPFAEQFPNEDGDRESTISDIARGVADREIEEESQRRSLIAQSRTSSVPPVAWAPTRTVATPTGAPTTTTVAQVDVPPDGVICPPAPVAVPPDGVNPHTDCQQRVVPEVTVATESVGGKGSREVRGISKTSEVVVESVVGNSGGRARSSRGKGGVNKETAQQKRCREEKVSDI